MLFRDGICTEGATSNVFAVKDGILYTHPADNQILKGITRQMIVTRCTVFKVLFTPSKRIRPRLCWMMRTNLFFTDTIVVSSRLSSQTKILYLVVNQVM